MRIKTGDTVIVIAGKNKGQGNEKRQYNRYRNHEY